MSKMNGNELNNYFALSSEDAKFEREASDFGAELKVLPESQDY